MAVKANNNYILYLKEREEGVEQLRRELNQQSFFELSDRQGNIIAYISDDGEVYVPHESDLIIKEIKGELTILDDY